jgi:hypothetical protein
VADVPSGVSLTLPEETKKENDQIKEYEMGEARRAHLSNEKRIEHFVHNVLSDIIT